MCLCQVGYAQNIDVETAWQRIVCYAPSIAAANAGVSALGWEAKQVSLMLNPVFEIESENLGINRPSDEVEPPQTTFSLAQTFEFGGKRHARFELASSVSTAAYWEAQIERENLRLEMKRAFIEIAAAQEKLLLAEQRLCVTEKIHEAVKKQIQCGKISPIQEKKRSIELMTESVALREARSQLEQAKTRLSSMWGCKCPDFDCVDFDLYVYQPPLNQSCYVEGFCHKPEYKKAQQAICSAMKNISLQKANRIPDVTLMAGYRIFHDSHEGGWVVGAALPLPFFDRNQGSIKSAMCELTQAQSYLDEIKREASERISVTYERLCASYQEVEMVCEGILREVQEAVDMTEKGYLNGKFDYLDLLEGEKMMVEVQEKYIDMLCEYHMNLEELSYLGGN